MPLAALAGVLMVTAFRMNEWASIRFMFSHRFKTAIITYLVTLVATITLDLTQAILIGGLLSAAIFINDVANMQVEVHDVDVARMRDRGIDVRTDCKAIRVAYLTGPLFFARHQPVQRGLCPRGRCAGVDPVHARRAPDRR